MTKKSINRKELIQVIEEKLESKISREEILKELSEQYFDKKTIAMMIASMPNLERKERFKVHNNVLLGLLVFIIFIKLSTGITLLSSVSVYLIPVAFLFPIVTIWLAVEVYHYKGYIYRAIGLLAIASALNTLANLNTAEFLSQIGIISSLTIAAYSFYIGYNLFPNYGMFGPKKDHEGNPLLE